MLKRVPSLFKNFYFSAGLFFIVWLAFFDSNDLVSRFRMSRKLNQLASEKEYYQEKIKQVKKDRHELMTNQELLEKFAREKYLMKKETEDIFIIEDQ